MTKIHDLKSHRSILMQCNLVINALNFVSVTAILRVAMFTPARGPIIPPPRQR